MILITKKKRPTRIMLWITPSLASVWKTRIKIKSALHMTWIFPDYYVEKLFKVQFQEFPKGQKKNPEFSNVISVRKCFNSCQTISGKQKENWKNQPNTFSFQWFPLLFKNYDSKKKNRQKVMETRTCDRE